MKTLILSVLLSISVLSATPGDLKWQVDTKDRNRITSPTLYNGVVFVGYYNEKQDTMKLLALNAMNGNTLWDKELDSYQEPAAAEDKVFIVNWHNYLEAIDANNGNKIWEKETFYDSNGRPCIKDGVVYVGSYGDEWGNASLYAGNANTGEMIWVAYGSDVASFQNPVVASNSVYITDYSGQLYAFNIKDGTKKWVFDTQNRGTSETPCIADGKAYVGTSTDSQLDALYCLNAYNGSLIWKYQGQDRGFGSPCYGEGLVFCPNVHYFDAVNANTGNGGWSFLPNAAVINSTPVYSGYRVYFGDSYGRFYALEASNGQEKWHFSTNGEIDCTPVLFEKTIIFTSHNGSIYCLEAEFTGFSSKSSAKSLPRTLSAHPNPFSTRLTLSLPSPASIYSLTGQLIKTLPKGRHEIDTRSWKAGVYIIKSAQEVKRIIKLDKQLKLQSLTQ